MGKKQIETLNSDLIGRIAGYMRVGADFYLSTAACGISREVAEGWELRANAAHEEKKPDIYSELYAATRTAGAQAEVLALQRLAAEGGTSGAMWLLEKINPEKYKKQQPSQQKKQNPLREIAGGFHGAKNKQ